MSLLTLAAKAISEARCDVATTSIWRVNGWLGKVLIYIENPDKTENPASFEKPDMDTKEAQGLSDVIEYAIQQKKTGKAVVDDEDVPVMQRFVSGVNCSPTTARDEMMAVKKAVWQGGRHGSLPRLSILCPRRGHAGAGP